ncbi:hypothetical protein [Paracoccus aestuarii]|uniref:hypothetical protein n=1 Tax=Paracoccus aestuarii TaxID=453842 RepID=UPI0011C41168|nr:hypothetical protein [Paracoccus aestuarii]WCQ98789.1 hypothetical protein JHW48_13080 [Paracoccus aestuarii]
MLDRWQMNTVFIVFIFIVVVLALSEAYLVIQVAQGDGGWVSAATAFITLLFLSAAGKTFLDISRKNFLDTSKLPVSVLKELAAEMAKIVSKPGLSEVAKRLELMHAILNFARSRMPDWAKGNHFEFCVFIDREFPVMVAYTDSALQSRNRSMSQRESNRTYYREKMYEAVKLLDGPQSQFHYINDTESSEINYSFVRDEQRVQIRSSLLACTDTDTPAILVISSNQRDAFSLADPDFNSFVRYLLEMIHLQTADGKLEELYRNERPELFLEVR